MSSLDSIPAVEVWKPVPGFEGLYDVSDQGRLRSWREAGGQHRKLSEPRVCRGGKLKYGYQSHFMGRGGGREQATIHELVLLAFVGARPDGMVARHLNGNPQDNRLENLAWGTWKQNTQDAIGHGTFKPIAPQRGVDHHAAKLDEDAVREIRRLANRATVSALSRQFSVSRLTIRQVIQRKVWKHVE